MKTDTPAAAGLDEAEREHLGSARALAGLTPEERATALFTWRQRLVLQRQACEQLERQGRVLQRLFVYACVLALLGAAAAFAAQGAPPGPAQAARVGLLLLAMAAVYRGWLLALEAFLLNLGAYLYARARGVAYAPYVPYGLLL